MTAFQISPDTLVVTSVYVTKLKKPVLLVTHEEDEEDGHLWQFHCGNGDYSPETMQLVRLDTVLLLDPSVQAVADLPLGYEAVRSSPTAEWRYQRSA